MAIPSTSDHPRAGSTALINPERTGSLRVVELGSTPYRECWNLQKRIFVSRELGDCPDTLLLTWHDHVYTLGKGADENHLLASAGELERAAAEMVRIDRGGDVTYHGPGQLVGYPVLDLRGHYLDIHRYLRELEDVIISTLGDFGLNGGREDGYTGVWVAGEKIAAIGVKVSRWITMHGFALNVNTDLTYFDRIIPCGIGHRGVTSMEKLLGKAVDMHDVVSSASKHFAEKFNLTPFAGKPDSVFGVNTQTSQNR